MRLLISLSLVFIMFTLSAQNTSEIKSDNSYYHGEAIAESEIEASEMALSELINKISVTVSASFKNKVKETDKDISKSVESIINTQAGATLRNVEKISSYDENNQVYTVLHFIKKSEVEKIFDERKHLIYEIYNNALGMEENGNISHALKWYYFATILLNSLPDQYVEVYGVNLSLELPNKIRSVLQNVDISFKSKDNVSEKESNVILNFSYNKKPVSYLEFDYHDGKNHVSCIAQNGTGTATLIGSSVNMDKLNLRIKYSFYECRDECKPVSQLWKITSKPKFNNSRKIKLERVEIQEDQIEIEGEPEIAKVDESIVKESEVVYSPVSFDNMKLTLKSADSVKCLEKITKGTGNFLGVLKGSLLNNRSSKNYDAFLLSKFRGLLKYNKSALYDNNIELEVNRTLEGWEVRGLPVSNDYRSINTKSNETLVLDFTKEGDLMDVNFCINRNLYDEFVKQAKYGNDWGNRQTIIKFIEKYRTAYMIRDLATVDTIFSDNAVIITGRVIKTAPKLKDYKNTRLLKEEIEYTRMNKNQYLKKLKSVFSFHKDIYLGFSSFNITKKQGIDGVYGVSMRQHYKASRYADEGHLFLLVDFKDTDPKIYVRSWQPQEWTDEKISKLTDFKILK